MGINPIDLRCQSISVEEGEKFTASIRHRRMSSCPSQIDLEDLPNRKSSTPARSPLQSTSSPPLSCRVKISARETFVEIYLFFSDCDTKREFFRRCWALKGIAKITKPQFFIPLTYSEIPFISGVCIQFDYTVVEKTIDRLLKTYPSLGQDLEDELDSLTL